MTSRADAASAGRERVRRVLRGGWRGKGVGGSTTAAAPGTRRRAFAAPQATGGRSLWRIIANVRETAA